MNTQASPPLRRFLGRGLVACLALFAALALLVFAEVLLRLIGSPPRESIVADDIRFAHSWSPVLGWVPRPGFHYVDRGIAYSVNRDGYRGRVHNRVRHSDGTVRVLLLGDSLTFGFRVADEEVFGALLDDSAQRRETINFGVEGYGVDQSVLRLREQGMSYSPDVVILSVCFANDFFDDLLPWFLYDGRQPKPYFTAATGRLVEHREHMSRTLAQRVALFLEEHSVLFRMCLPPARQETPAEREERAFTRPFAVADYGAANMREFLRLPAGEQLQFWRRASDITFRLIAEAARLSAQGHARFHVLFFPNTPDSLSPGSMYDREVEIARASPHLQAVAIVDMGRAMRAAGATPARFADYYLDTHCHLTPGGHRFVAAEIERLLEDQSR